MLGTLYADDEHEYMIWKWRPVDATRTGAQHERRHEVAVLGVGHAPVGQVGTQLRRVRRGRGPRRPRRRRHRLARRAVRLRRRHDAQRLPRLRRRRHVRPGARLDRAPGCRQLLRAPARRARRRSTAPRAQILAGLCDVALVVGADTTPKGFLAPNGGERGDDPDWLRFRLLGATNPTYFALYARRRMELYGATDRGLRPGQGEERRATASRTRTPATARRSPSTTSLASPMVADPLRLLDICATSDGGAALVLTQHGLRPQRWRSAGPPIRGADRGRLDGHADVPEHRHRDAELRDRLGRGVAPVPERGFKQSIARRGLRAGRPRPRRRRPRRGLRPVDRARARLVRGHRPLRPGRGREAAARRRHHARRTTSRSTSSGGLACFGEAVPAQAHRAGVRAHLAAPGQAAGRQVEGATVGITANQGLFGHGSSVILTKSPAPIVAHAHICPPRADGVEGTSRSDSTDIGSGPTATGCGSRPAVRPGPLFVLARCSPARAWSDRPLPTARCRPPARSPRRRPVRDTDGHVAAPFRGPHEHFRHSAGRRRTVRRPRRQIHAVGPHLRHRQRARLQRHGLLLRRSRRSARPRGRLGRRARVRLLPVGPARRALERGLRRHGARGRGDGVPRVRLRVGPGQVARGPRPRTPGRAGPPHHRRRDR